jgi:hypothetical protein
MSNANAAFFCCFRCLRTADDVTNGDTTPAIGLELVLECIKVSTSAPQLPQKGGSAGALEPFCSGTS